MIETLNKQFEAVKVIENQIAWIFENEIDNRIFEKLENESKIYSAND